MLFFSFRSLCLPRDPSATRVRRLGSQKGAPLVAPSSLVLDLWPLGHVRVFLPARRVLRILFTSPPAQRQSQFSQPRPPRPPLPRLRPRPAHAPRPLPRRHRQSFFRRQRRPRVARSLSYAARDCLGALVFSSCSRLSPSGCVSYPPRLARLHLQLSA